MGTYIEIDSAGRYTLVKGNETLVMPLGATVEEINQAQVAFFGIDLSLPEPFPMHRLRQFLIATNRKNQIINWLNTLPEPQKSMAKEEFEYAPNFVPDSALGRAAQAALGLSDADYAEAIRTAAQHTVDDYGSPSPTLVQRITKFFFGG